MAKSFSFLYEKRVLLLTIAAVFTCFYNASIYTSKPAVKASVLSTEALAGQLIWQESNCTACHQFYGLGGYLGPDLTNVASAQGKGVPYLKAFLNSGIKSMPKYNFNENEKDQLAEFLKHVDRTGFYPNPASETIWFGWVNQIYKEPSDE
ncbi:MAG: nitric oxide reductase subunit C [Bacteroidia bacterium]|jgi:nitric oxide reductase subunit C